MPAFVQVSEDQNSAMLWPERPVVLKFVPSFDRTQHVCSRCHCSANSPGLCHNMPCGLADHGNAPTLVPRHSADLMRPRADGLVGRFELIN
jgi:hypothetical protein